MKVHHEQYKDLLLCYFSVYFPEEKVEEETVVDQEKPSQNHDKPDDDYLGENVTYDVHE